MPPFDKENHLTLEQFKLKLNNQKKYRSKRDLGEKRVKGEKRIKSPSGVPSNVIRKDVYNKYSRRFSVDSPRYEQQRHPSIPTCALIGTIQAFVSLHYRYKIFL